MTMVPIQEHIDHLLGLVFNKDASSSDLFMLACVWGVFWAIFFFIAGILLTPLVYGKEWLRRATEKEIERSGGAEEMNKMHGDNKTKEEWIDVMMKAWVKNQLMIPVQHVASGVPCIPSLLGIGDPAWASSLAAQGLLCEMGWELSDFVELIYKRLRYGEKMIPNGHLIMATLHHSLSCTLAIPMIRRYREWKALHAITFLFAGLPGLTLPLTEYSRLLDLSKPNELSQFKAINVIMFLVIFLTRGVYWVYVVCQAVVTLYGDKEWGLLCVVVPVLVLFSMVNALFVSSSFKRMMKFRKASAEDQALPKDASEKKKLESKANLEQAAMELLDEAENIDPMNGLRSLVDNFQVRKVERRQTMPPLLHKKLTMKSMRMGRAVSVPPRAWKED